ncbi:MAG TPA: hypothetical protein VFA20_14595 [Myxococcaceae bacterium]|nr:hypothetical protein [Myxococcaceae bacterium]
MPRAFRLSAVLVVILAVQALPAWAQLEGKPFEQGMRAPDALLDGSAHDRHTQIAAFGNYSWYLGVGAGLRYSLPILKDGFIPELNDSVEVEAGGNFLLGLFGGGPSVIIAALEPKWTFHFTPQLDAYAKLGIGFFIWLGQTNFTPVNVMAWAGVAYKFSPNFWVRLEGGVLGAALGAGLDF